MKGLRGHDSYHVSNCDTVEGEVFACPTIVARKKEEFARGCREHIWERGLGKLAEKEASGMYASAVYARDGALQALASEEKLDRMDKRAQLSREMSEQVSVPLSCTLPNCKRNL